MNNEIARYSEETFESIKHVNAYSENPGHGNALGLLSGEEGNHHTEQASPRSTKALH